MSIARAIYGPNASPDIIANFDYLRNGLFCYVYTCARDGHITIAEEQAILDALHHADIQQLESINRYAIRERRLTANDLYQFIPRRPNFPPRRSAVSKHKNQRQKLEASYLSQLQELVSTKRMSYGAAAVLISEVPHMSDRELHDKLKLMPEEVVVEVAAKGHLLILA